MKKYKINRLPTRQNVTLKNQIVKTRNRAKWIGTVYFTASFFVLIVACFPLMKSDFVKVGLPAVWREFTLSSFKSMNTAVNVMPFLLALLYIGMLVLLLILLVRAACGVGELFKNKANKKYGFNLNLNAMQRMGQLFSDMFCIVLGVYFIIFVLSGNAKPTVLFYAFGVVGLLVHFVCGLCGGKLSYFEVDAEGKMVERRRTIGRVVPFFRNFVQVVGICAMMYFFFQTSRIHECIEAMLKKDVWVNHFLKNVVSFASLLLQFLTGFSLLVLLKHTTGTAEFDMHGIRASGMKNYRVFAFFIFLASGATFGYRAMFGEVQLQYLQQEERTLISITQWIDWKSLILSGLGLVMFVFEVVMRNYPHERVATNDLEATFDDADNLSETDRAYKGNNPENAYVAQRAVDFTTRDEPPRSAGI